MKKQLITLVAILIASFTFAQDGMNYKALITDNGNALTNHTVTIQFTVLQNGTTNVYQETHTLTTDANGIVVANIGEGTVVNGTFNNVDWSNNQFLKVEIDTGSGYADFGTTAFKYVPKAKFANKAGAVDYANITNMPADIADGDDDTHLTETQVDAMVSNNGYLTSGDNWGNQVVTSNSSLNGNGTSAQPLAVNTNATAFNGWDKNASDDFSGNYSDLSNKPAVFLVETSSAVATQASQNIRHSGNIRIGNFFTSHGQNTSALVINRRLNNNDNSNGVSIAVNSMGIGIHRAVNNSVGGTGNGSHYGVVNSIANSGNGSHYGVVNSIANSGDGEHYGVSNYLSSTGNGRQLGLYNNISNTGSSEHYGVYNKMQGDGTGWQYGVRNNIINTGNAPHYGNYSTLSGSGTGDHTGAYNVLSGTGSGSQFGTKNDINNSGDGIHYGSYTNLSGSGSGRHYSTYNRIAGAGTGEQLGTANFIVNTGNNSHFGVKTTLSGNGSGQHYGTYNSLIGDGAGIQGGFVTDIYTSGNAKHYGVKTRLTGVGTGNKYGIYSKISATAGGEHYAVYGEATKDATDVYAGYFVGDVNIKTGNLNVEDKLTAPASGSADMKAYIYGTLEGGSSSVSIVPNGSSDGFTVSRIDIGKYEVTLSDTSITSNDYTIIATSYASSSPELITYVKSGNKFILHAWNLAGSHRDTILSFIVFKK